MHLGRRLQESLKEERILGLLLCRPTWPMPVKQNVLKHQPLDYWNQRHNQTASPPGVSTWCLWHHQLLITAAWSATAAVLAVFVLLPQRRHLGLLTWLPPLSYTMVRACNSNYWVTTSQAAHLELPYTKVRYWKGKWFFHHILWRELWFW